jgi:hypothetical protein
VLVNEIDQFNNVPPSPNVSSVTFKVQVPFIVHVFRLESAPPSGIKEPVKGAAPELIKTEAVGVKQVLV